MRLEGKQSLFFTVIRTCFADLEAELYNASVKSEDPLSFFRVIAEIVPD
jgi:hypothetical protein